MIANLDFYLMLKQLSIIAYLAMISSFIVLYEASNRLALWLIEQ